jgi:hypothetical protein
MTQKKKSFVANLIKYRQADMKDPIWFWINPSTGTIISDEFTTSEAAEKWFDDVLYIHNETYDLIERSMKGKFFKVKGKVDVGDVISSKKANECPFTMHLEDDIMEFDLLAKDVEDAKKRVSEFFEILEWYEV